MTGNKSDITFRSLKVRAMRAVRTCIKSAPVVSGISLATTSRPPVLTLPLIHLATRFTVDGTIHRQRALCVPCAHRMILMQIPSEFSSRGVDVLFTCTPVHSWRVSRMARSGSRRAIFRHSFTHQIGYFIHPTGPKGFFVETPSYA